MSYKSSPRLRVRNPNSSAHQPSPIPVLLSLRYQEGGQHLPPHSPAQASLISSGRHRTALPRPHRLFLRCPASIRDAGRSHINSLSDINIIMAASSSCSCIPSSRGGTGGFSDSGPRSAGTLLWTGRRVRLEGMYKSTALGLGMLEMEVMVGLLLRINDVFADRCLDKTRVVGVYFRSMRVVHLFPEVVPKVLRLPSSLALMRNYFLSALSICSEKSVLSRETV